MPKAEKGSIKDLGKRIKSKGLQKLRFYCQMCEKQCRDANGFKCHLTSDSHLRQMKIFSEHAGAYMDRYSKEFEKMYLDTLRMRHSTAKVNANNVYQEVIQDKQHIHMNSTMWASLSDFCKYLGKIGKCVVEETERGWYIQYIERDVTKLKREEDQKRRVQAEHEAEIATQQRMESQRVEAAKALDRAGGALHAKATTLDREQPIQKLTLGSVGKPTKKRKAAKMVSGFGEEDSDDSDHTGNGAVEQNEKKKNTTIQAVEDQKSRITVEQSTRNKVSAQETSAKSHRKKAQMIGDIDGNDKVWLHRDVWVRIVSKKVGDGKYYCKKGIVDSVQGDTAEIGIVDDTDETLDGSVLHVDQRDLETVAPKKIDQQVRILRGPYRGKKARSVDLNTKKHRATLKLKDGTMLEKVSYDDFSKLA